MSLPIVNRSAVLLIARQSFIDWINRCPDPDLEMTLEDLNDEPTVYLIPEQDGRPDDWLRRHFQKLFEEELESWCTDESLWPKDRSYAVFRQFFDVRFSSLVVDMTSEPIKTDEDE